MIARHFLRRWISLMLVIQLSACGGSGSDDAPPVNTPPVDAVAPVIALIGDSMMTHDQGAAFTDPGAIANDNVDGNISANIAASGNVDINTLGIYTITYTVMDSAGNAATPVTREVNVIAPPDTTAPVITLIGDALVTQTIGSVFTDQGATATDDVDGDISTNIGIAGAVDANTLGTYTIRYTVMDSAGNAAKPVTREVNIIALPDTTAPVMTLIGDSFMTHVQGTVFNDPGATATDDVDGDIAAIIITGSVDIDTLGTYAIDYSAVDLSGNVATPATRTVEVVPPPLVLEMTPTTTKQFVFTWNDSDGEDEYKLLENPDGHSGFTEIASLLADTTEYSHFVALYDRFNAQYIIEACDSGVCTQSDTYSVSDNLATAIGNITASNADEDDEFGFSVALSGDGSTLAVGAPTEDSNGAQDDNSAVDAGAVYVYKRVANAWTQQAYLKASNADADDEFGISVALSDDGDTLAVGAAGEASNSTGINGDQNDNSALDSGAVYVFKRTVLVTPQAPFLVVEWSQQAYIKASNTDTDDEFGAAIALSDDGDTLAVGATREDSNATGSFGGDDSDNSAVNTGAAYIFTRVGSDWSHKAYLKASNTNDSDFFGGKLALSGDGLTLVAGARAEDSSATGINGNQNDGAAGASGAAYVFTLDAGLWRQQAYLKASNTGFADGFGGNSLALSSDGNTLAVGAILEDSNATGVNGDQDNDLTPSSGAVYLFSRTGSDWSQKAYLKASNTGRTDFFGRSLSLNSNGDTLAVGAYLEDGNAIGINGDQDNDLGFQSGAVYVFGLDGGVWTQRAYLKASNDSFQFGYSVALSDDGDTLAVGAITDADTGAVYLY